MQSSGTRSALLALVLVAAIGCVFLTAKLFGFLPDQLTQDLQNRAALCEALAISSSEMATRDDWDGLARTIRQAAALHPELRAARVVDHTGHVRWNWDNAAADNAAADSGSNALDSVDAPLYSDGKSWGVLRLSFARRGGLGYFVSNYGAGLFVAMMCFVIFTIVLGYILQRLSGSDVPPRHVQLSIDQVRESMVMVDHRERIVLANKIFCELVGNNLAALQGSKIGALPWRSQDGPAPWLTSLSSGSTVADHTLRLVPHRQTPRKLLANCIPIRGKKGGIRGALLCMTDVTEYEQQMRELQLVRSSPQGDLMRSAVLRNVGQRLSAQAGSVCAVGQGLRRGLGANSGLLHRMYEHLVNSGRSLVGLQRDISDLQRLGEGHVTISRRSCSPHLILANVYRRFEAPAEQKGLTLQFNSEGSLPMSINSDPERIERILGHLVDNAIKFSEKGVIRVTASIGQVEHRHQLRIEVSDQGEGVANDLLPKIFQPFADLGEGRRGGLGLAVSKASAEVLGGSLSVASAVGRGSAFLLRVDTGQLKAVSNRPLRSHDLQPRRSQSERAISERFVGKALVADHDFHARQTFALLLESLGLQVTLAANGREALQAADRDVFDLVFLDTQLAGGDGPTATRQLRRRGFANPIVAITEDPAEQDACRQAGFTRMLLKPVQLDPLLFCLQRTLPQQEDSALVHKSTLPIRPAARAIESGQEENSDQPSNWLKLSGNSDPAILAASSDSDTQLPRPGEHQAPLIASTAMTFLEEFEHQRVRLNQYASRREMKEIQREAVLLHQTALEIGLLGMAEAANNLIRMAQQGDPNGVELVLERLDSFAETILTQGQAVPIHQAATRESGEH